MHKFLFDMVIRILDRRFKVGHFDQETRHSMTLLASWLDQNVRRDRAGLLPMTYQQFLIYVFGGSET